MKNLFSMGLQLRVLGRLSKLVAGFSLPSSPTLFIAAILFSSPAFAGFSVEAHLYSQHFVDSDMFGEEHHPGLGVNFQFSENWSVLLGEYENSLTSYQLECHGDVCAWEKNRIDSRYLSFERTLRETGEYEFGAGLGVADGYKEFTDENGVRFKKGSDINPMAGPYLNLKGSLINLDDRISIKLRYMFVVASLSAQYTF